MRRSIGAGAAALAIGAGLLVPGQGIAAVTIGSSLAGGPGASYNCNSNHPCTVRQRALLPGLTAAGGLTSPIDGVVVGFRVNNGPSTAPIQLRVIHPAGGGLFVGAGTSPAVTPPASQISPLFPARLPIKAGDSAGLECCFSGQNDLVRVAGGGAGNSFDTWGTQLSPVLADGGAALAPDANNPDAELTMNAVVELDGDLDNYGDETQDGCPNQGALQATPCSTGFALTKVTAVGPTVQVTAHLPGAGQLRAGDLTDPSVTALASKKKKKKKVTRLLTSTSAARAEKAAGDLVLTLGLTKAARARLRQKGKLAVALKVIYAPTGGSPSVQLTAPTKLKGKKKRKKS